MSTTRNLFLVRGFARLRADEVLSRAGKYPKGATGSARRQSMQLHYFCKLHIAFLQTQEVSRLRARPKGFPIALWKPSVQMCEICYK